MPKKKTGRLLYVVHGTHVDFTDGGILVGVFHRLSHAKRVMRNNLAKHEAHELKITPVTVDTDLYSVVSPKQRK